MSIYTKGLQLIVDCRRERLVDLPIFTVDKLIASLFYPELSNVPCVHPGPAARIIICIKCRLVPGPYLSDLILRMRRENVLIRYCGDESWILEELCSPQSWDDIRADRPFKGTIAVSVQSSSTIINIQIQGQEETQLSLQYISHCNT